MHLSLLNQYLNVVWVIFFWTFEVLKPVYVCLSRLIPSDMNVRQYAQSLISTYRYKKHFLFFYHKYAWLND